MKHPSYFRSKISKGFTLVELLIVVIILAILAAILVPQFASSTDEAKSSSLDTTLSNMRSAIDLYYQQHGKYPAAVVSTGGTCDTGTADTTGSTVNSSAAFIAQMTRFTNSAGQACSGTGANFKYGPYLKKDTLPLNPITNSNALVVSTTGTLPLTSTTAGAGWLYDVKTGQFVANDTNTDPSGLAYFKR